MFDFGIAISHLRNGQRVARTGWNGKGMWLALQVPDEHSKMTEPYVYMKTAQGGLIPWLCSQADLLATDWVVVVEDGRELCPDGFPYCGGPNGHDEEAHRKAQQTDVLGTDWTVVGDVSTTSEPVCTPAEIANGTCTR